MTKEELKKKAIILRKEGKTYSEILKEVPVAKSTLSLWSKDVGLSKAQKQRITKKRLEAGKRGGAKRRQMRIEKTKEIFEKAKKDIGRISKRDLWLTGVMLHWAGGAKEREGNTGVGIDFGNSDYRMIQVFLKWLEECLGVDRKRIHFRLYIHENSRKDIDKVLQFWSDKTGFPKRHIKSVYFKKHNPKTKRKNTGKRYKGLLAVRVRKSTALNRRVAGWVNGFVEQL